MTGDATVGETPGLDVAVLEEHLRREVPDLLAGPLSASLVPGGRSNLTYVLADGYRRWVLRRPPLGHVLESAHDMGREYRVMAALHPTEVPVPDMVVMDASPDLLGAPFYIMSFVDGTIFRSAEQLHALMPADGEQVADELVDVLCRIHEVDLADVGLGRLGRPDGFLERQLRRWSTQLEAAHSREVDGLRDLGAQLVRSLPATSRTALVHGDYKLDNVVVDATGSVSAVLDWEMATLGDPLMDLANVTLWWDGVVDVDGVPFAAAPGDVPNLPTSERLLTRYAAAKDVDLADMVWYDGLACFKLAAIFEGMHHRATLGLTVGEGFDTLSGLAPALAQRGHDALRTRT